MTILAENLKAIRKKLNYTQMALSEELEIGFRTYVRYEAGERDAPVSVLVKIAKLTKMSLDRLLTTKVTPEDLTVADVKKPPKTAKNLTVIGGGLEEGRLVFKGLKEGYYISADKSEKKLMTLFRKMDNSARDKCLGEMEWTVNNRKSDHNAGAKKRGGRKTMKAKNTARLKKMAKAIGKITLRG